jgi:ubiquinone/menaquinone biosynthesis C-methylase UbiE
MNTPEMAPPDQIRAAWDRLAEDFDRFTTPLNLRLAEDALGRVGLRPGMRFLDVAAGSGALSIPAARLGAEVLATDIAPAMIARLAARAREEGLGNLDARVMDGHALDLEDDLFDVTGSQFGIMLFPDLARGLSEVRRVTKPGGRVVVIAFGPPRTVEFLGFFIGGVTAVVPGFTGLGMDPLPLPFQVADREVLRSKWPTPDWTMFTWRPPITPSRSTRDDTCGTWSRTAIRWERRWSRTSRRSKRAWSTTSWTGCSGSGPEAGRPFCTTRSTSRSAPNDGRWMKPLANRTGGGTTMSDPLVGRAPPDRHGVRTADPRVHRTASASGAAPFLPLPGALCSRTRPAII